MAAAVATLDHLSEGRLDFGVGRFAFPSVYLGYGMSYAESRDRFDECLEVILKSWTAERFSFHGKYYQYDDLCVVPKPLRKPHPPIRIGATRRRPLLWWDGWATPSSSIRPGSPRCWT